MWSPRYSIVAAIAVMAIILIFNYPQIVGPKLYTVPVSVGVLPAGATIDGIATTTPMITVVDHGDQKYVLLQYLAVSINGINQNDIRPQSGWTVLAENAEGDYPVNDPNNNHVVVTGHFSDGTVKVLADTEV